jgi:hypothetical protein
MTDQELLKFVSAEWDLARSLLRDVVNDYSADQLNPDLLDCIKEYVGEQRTGD